ncbi:unnamed protein product [Rhodiola kirilowii]
MIMRDDKKNNSPPVEERSDKARAATKGLQANREEQTLAVLETLFSAKSPKPSMFPENQHNGHRATSLKAPGISELTSIKAADMTHLTSINAPDVTKSNQALFLDYKGAEESSVFKGAVEPLNRMGFLLHSREKSHLESIEPFVESMDFIGSVGHSRGGGDPTLTPWSRFTHYSKALKLH